HCAVSRAAASSVWAKPPHDLDCRLRISSVASFQGSTSADQMGWLSIIPPLIASVCSDEGERRVNVGRGKIGAKSAVSPAAAPGPGELEGRIRGDSRRGPQGTCQPVEVVVVCPPPPLPLPLQWRCLACVPLSRRPLLTTTLP